MKTLSSWFRKNTALTLVSINAFLLNLLILPGVMLEFGDATLLPIKRDEITGMEFTYGQGLIRLERQSEKLRSGKSEGADEKKRDVEYRWKLLLSDGRSYNADSDRIRDLLKTLTSLQSHYELPLDDTTRSAYQLGEDSVRLTIHTGDATQTVLIGRASQRQDATYLQLEGKNDIHEVDGNVRVKLGSGDSQFFRDRAILPPEVDMDSIASLSFLRPDRSVRLARAGSEWQMVEPRPGKLRDDLFRPVLEDILHWKARSFPDSIPAGVRRDPARIEITYHKGSTDPGVVQLDIEAVGDYGTYYIRSGETLYTVSSYYLEDLKSPEKLLDRAERPVK